MGTVLRIAGDVLAVLVVLAFIGVGVAVWLHGAERPSTAEPRSNLRVLRPPSRPGPEIPRIADWEREGWA